MKKRWLAGLFVALILLVSLSCSDDTEDPVGPEPSPYKALTQKDHVLLNLELACKSRNLMEFDKLLDEDFVFHFSQADFKDGNVRVEEWDRASELASATNMFDEDYSRPGVDPISQIGLTLTYVEGDAAWDPVTPDDQVTYPGETWYEKTVRYDLICTSGPIDYTGLNIQASFIVRQSAVGGKNVWRIISWRDDTQNLLAQLSDRTANNSSTEVSTWGKVKALYSN
jgi:hypothetical protein